LNRYHQRPASVRFVETKLLLEGVVFENEVTRLKFANDLARLSHAWRIVLLEMRKVATLIIFRLQGVRPG
jgi:hypothetical protein